MTSQLDDFYDYYTDSLDGEHYKAHQGTLEVEVQQNYYQMFNKYKDAMLIVSFVVAILVVIKCLKRCIKQRRDKGELKV